MQIHLESQPDHYVGSYPSITIHYRETSGKQEALDLKALILEAIEARKEKDDLHK